MTVVLLAMLVCLGDGFFLYSKKAAGPSNGQWPPHQYSTRAESVWPPLPPQPSQGTYAFDATNGALTVALPVAVPVQAQMATAALATPAHSPAPAATFHNVQLVPCLCPVAKDLEPSPPPAPTVSPSSPSYVIQSSSPP